MTEPIDTTVVKKRRFRELRMALGWGCAWGGAMGFWLLAPPLVSFHHINPAGFFDWFKLALALLLAFLFTAAVCSVIAGFPLMLWETLRGRRFTHRSWAYGLGVGVLFGPAYICYTSYLIWVPFGSSAGTDSFKLLSHAVSIPLAGLSLLALTVYRHVRLRPTLVPASWLAIALLVFTVFGGVTLAQRVTLPPRGASGVAATSGTSLTPLRDRPSPVAPLLFVGIDAAHWRALRPLLEQGKLPVLARLSATGVRGSIEALWPPYWSGPAWAAIVTGHPREETGIYEDLSLEVPGLLRYQIPVGLDPLLAPFTFLQYALVRTGMLNLSPPPRTMLKQDPFWELTTHAGVRTAVVRFPFTFPANGTEADVVISDAVGHDAWSLVGVRSATGPLNIFPAAMANGILDAFAAESPPDSEDLAGFLSDQAYRRPSDSFFDPIPMLRMALKVDGGTFDAGERILSTYPDLGALVVYLGGFDSICHAFWHYRFADEFSEDRPDQKDIDQLGKVLDHYLEFLDRGLDRLIAEFPTPPNVIVVSDHGYEANPGTVFKGGHSREGIFIAAGPGVQRRADEVEVSYYDVVPTVTQLLGFAKPEGARGHSIVPR